MHVDVAKIVITLISTKLIGSHGPSYLLILTLKTPARVCERAGGRAGEQRKEERVRRGGRVRKKWRRRGKGAESVSEVKGGRGR